MNLLSQIVHNGYIEFEQIHALRLFLMNSRQSSRLGKFMTRRSLKMRKPLRTENVGETTGSFGQIWLNNRMILFEL